MESLYDPKGNKNIIDRIDSLTPIKLSLWGKMTVSQMLEHCQQPIKVCFGTLHIKPHWKSYFLKNSYKKVLHSKQPFRRDLSTIKEYNITHEPHFETAKQQLKELVATFAKEGHGCIKQHRHPLMGNLTHHEWDLLQWKHLDHHLKQFGV